MKAWQSRFVSVQDKKLKYFKSQGDRVACGVLNFDHFCCNIKQDGCTFKIQMTGNDRIFEFKAESQEIAQNWT